MIIKKLLILLAFVSLTLTSCSKEDEVTTAVEVEVDCHCGIATPNGGMWDTATGRQTRWSYIVRNNCTNAPKYLNYLTSPLPSEIYCLDYQW